MADYKLIVVEAFDDYRRGDEITDNKVMKTILAEHEHKVRKVPNTTKKEG